MKQFTFIILLLVFSHWLSAQNYLNKDDLPESFYKHMEGKIVREYPKENAVNELKITMNMRRRGDVISGTYFYESDTLSLKLNGFVLNEGIFEFEAVDPDYNVLGNFRGRFTDQHTLSGKLMVPNQSQKETWLFTLKENYENSVDFKVYQFEDKHHVNNNPDYPYIQISMDFLYPKAYKDKRILKKIQTLVEKEFFGKYAIEHNPKLNIKKKRNEAFSEYKQYVEQNYQYDPENVQYYIWKSEYVSDVIYNSGEILTIKIKSEEIVGGEAQFGGVNYLVIDMSDGEPILLEDIFRDGYKKALATLITRKLKEDYDVSENYELIENNFLIDMIEPNENYYIDRKGIGFYFPPYAINEFEVRVYISYREMGQILKKQSPISRFFPDEMKFGDMQALIEAREDMLDLYKTVKKQRMPDPSEQFEYPQSEEGGNVQYPDQSEEGGEVQYPDQSEEGGEVQYPDQGGQDTSGVTYPDPSQSPDTTNQVTYPDQQ